jgi:hypothetical protein
MIDQIEAIDCKSLGLHNQQEDSIVLIIGVLNLLNYLEL